MHHFSRNFKNAQPLDADGIKSLEREIRLVLILYNDRDDGQRTKCISHIEFAVTHNNFKGEILFLSKDDQHLPAILQYAIMMQAKLDFPLNRYWTVY